MASSEAATNQPNDEYEEKNVHEVYQQIANHFSATRYKVGAPPRPFSLPGFADHVGSHGQLWNGSSRN